MSWRLRFYSGLLTMGFQVGVDIWVDRSPPPCADEISCEDFCGKLSHGQPVRLGMLLRERFIAASSGSEKLFDS